MEANSKRKIKNGAQYDHLFPKARLVDVTVKKGATVEDTVKLIPEVVKKTKWQAKKFVEAQLKGLSTYEVCKKLWHFIYDHIDYKKDETNREQIRSFRRSWHERFSGVDCDCYTTFISTVLSNLGIGHLLRIAKYSQDHFQHIYPIVPLKDGSYITIDCVVNRFNYEEPYTEIKDTKMDLEFLDGIEDENITGTDDLEGFDGWEELYGFEGWEDLGELGKIKFKLPKIKLPKIKLPKINVGNIIKKGLHAINKFNPATVLLRNGVLASMKLNTFNVAGRLRWSYLSEADAVKKGMNMNSYHSIKKIREKLETIFHGAGGEPSNLKKSILKGKGNSDHSVAGLDGIYMSEDELSGLEGADENTPLPQLLGPEIWHSENVEGFDELEGFEGLGQLGEPVTATAIAAASGAIATISALLKNVGNLFSGGNPSGNADNPGASSTAQVNISPQEGGATPGDANPGNAALPPPSDTQQDDEADMSNPTNMIQKPNALLPAKSTVAVANKASPAKAALSLSSLWQNNQKWLKPTLLGAGGLAVLVIGYKLVSSRARPVQGLAGLRSKKKKAKHKRRSHRAKRKAIALM